MEFESKLRFHTGHSKRARPFGVLKAGAILDPPKDYKESPEPLRYDEPEVCLKASRWFRKLL